MDRIRDPQACNAFLDHPLLNDASILLINKAANLTTGL